MTLMRLVEVSGVLSGKGTDPELGAGPSAKCSVGRFYSSQVKNLLSAGALLCLKIHPEYI